MLDESSTIGGTWARRRLYPGLRTNNLLGTYEYSDFPMDEATFGVKKGEFIPGYAVHEYLEKYAQRFGVYERIRFNCKVESAERKPDGDNGWILTVNPAIGSPCSEGSIKISTRKLIIATGLTSEPFVPPLKGVADFNAPVFHSKDFLDHADTLNTASSAVVLGGSKSAFDVAYAYAAKGVTVDLVIRASGHGPAWCAPPYVTPFRKWLEKLVNLRLLTWLSPCIWGHADGFDGIRKFLNKTFIGRKVISAFWAILAGDVDSLNKYSSHPETAKLKPWQPVFGVGSGLCILNYPTDWFELVRSGKIRVHIADVSRLSDHTVHLSTGASLHTSALICATGWVHRPPLKFLPVGLDAELGLPHFASTPDDLGAAAEAEILNRYPYLQTQEPSKAQQKPIPGSEADPAIINTPYLLYRFMVPTADVLKDEPARDIGFSGMIMTISTPLCAQAQALWLTAYLDGKLTPRVVSVEPPAAPSSDLSSRSLADSTAPSATAMNEKFGSVTITSSAIPNTPNVDKPSSVPFSAPVPARTPTPTQSDIFWETQLQNRFGKWRYTAGHGSLFPDFVFDAIPHLDMLLGDLGLRSRRKVASFWNWREVLEPYGPEDYRGLVGEWIEVQAERERSEK